MMRFKPLPDVDLVRGRLSFDADTGIFRWKVAPCLWIQAGEMAGTITPNGYLTIGVAGLGTFLAHRLAWLHHYGVSPDGEIDHIDGNRADNRIANLRLASSSQQKRNKRVQSNSRSGLKGAYFHACRRGKKWRSQIKVDGVLIFLGYFDTPEEAHASYANAAREHFGEFARVA